MASVQFDLEVAEGCDCQTGEDALATGRDSWQGLRRYLHAVVQRRAGETHLEDRSDVVQQTLLEAQQQHVAGNSPSEPQHYRHWLRKILCCNLADAARDSLRQKRDVRREVRFASGAEGAREGWLPTVDQIVADQTSPSQRSVRAEHELVVRQAIGELPDNYRRVICLKFFDNLPVAQIATEVEMTKSSVAGLLCRGMRKLRAELLKKGITIE